MVVDFQGCNFFTLRNLHLGWGLRAPPRSLVKPPQSPCHHLRRRGMRTSKCRKQPGIFYIFFGLLNPEITVYVPSHGLDLWGSGVKPLRSFFSAYCFWLSFARCPFAKTLYRNVQIKVEHLGFGFKNICETTTTSVNAIVFPKARWRLRNTGDHDKNEDMR